MIPSPTSSAAPEFPIVRTPPSERRFESPAIEAAISEFKSSVADPELGWLFENCFPNTLDTTVTFEVRDGRPSTYVITGDIDAMWLRDSTAQVWPYLKFLHDSQLQQLVAGLIRKQAQCIVRDPYANAFYSGEQVGHWASDFTDMRPGVHERKWEIDSLCYPIRLAYHFWKITGDSSPFDSIWLSSVRATLQTFREQQRKSGPGPYKFQRSTPHATDTQPLSGYGYPVNPVGLICSSFRPSDDATIFPFLIPSNFFAALSLRQAAEIVEIVEHIGAEDALAGELVALAQEVEDALREHAVVEHAEFGLVFAFEVNGFGSHVLMDDANIPSLLSLPYLGAVGDDDEVYANTRRMLLSDSNPFFFRGSVAEGIGGPHVGMDMIWPMSIIMRALTSQDSDEIRACVQSLKKTHAGTGFMHEAFHKDDAANFTRSWFAWTNTLLGELLWKLHQESPALLD